MEGLWQLQMVAAKLSSGLRTKCFSLRFKPDMWARKEKVELGQQLYNATFPSLTPAGPQPCPRQLPAVVILAQDTCRTKTLQPLPLHYLTVHYITLQFTTLPYIIFNITTFHYITLQCTTLPCFVLYLICSTWSSTLPLATCSNHFYLKVSAVSWTQAVRCSAVEYSAMH